MSYIVDSLRQIIGLDPVKPGPKDRQPEVVAIMTEKRKEKLTKDGLRAAEAGRALAAERHKWRNRRWVTLIIANLLFVVSYYFDVQLLEGALTASRLIGFHLADLNSALQVMLAYQHVVLNLVIGTVTVFSSGCCWVGAPSVPGPAPITSWRKGRKRSISGWPSATGPGISGSTAWAASGSI
jgi:ferredoxin-type protein NapH